MQRFCIDADAHRAEFVAALGDLIPYEDVAAEPRRLLCIDRAGFRDPIVVIGGAHFVRIAIFKG